MKIIQQNNNILTCRCGYTLKYTVSDIRIKSDCFYNGYLEDEYYDINYVHCPFCGRDTEIGWNFRKEKSG